MVKCKACGYEYTYEDRGNIICTSCGFEWNPADDIKVYIDSAGNELREGDDVTLIKDLNIGSSSTVIKRGTKGKNIQLGEFKDNHDISCKIQGIGHIYLKTSVVKKVN